MDKNNNPFANVSRIVAQVAAFILLFAVTLSCEKKEDPPQLSSETEILSVTVDGLIDTHIQVRTDPDAIEFLRVTYGGNHVSLAFVGLTVSHGTELSTLRPQFTLSPGATITQVLEFIVDAYGIHKMDFSHGQVHYVITAEDGKTTSYVIAAAWHPREVKGAIARSSTSTTYVNISHSAGGRTNPAAGRHRHDIQFQLNILSAPSHLYRLRAWYVNGVHRSTGATFWDFVSANDTIRAEFERIPPGIVTVQSQNINMGTASLTVHPDGTVTIRAVPTQGHEFVGWYRNNVRWGTNVPAHFTFFPPENIALVARFRSITPPSFSGPATVCLGTSATFTISYFPPGATTRWVVEPPLSITSSNNYSAVIGHTGITTPTNSRIRAEISMNGQVLHTLERYPVVNRPFIQRVLGSTMPMGRERFTAELPRMSRADYFRWWLDAPPGSYSLVGNTNWETVEIQFHRGGFFTLLVEAVNMCGRGAVYFMSIFAIDEQPFPGLLSQPIPVSETLHIVTLRNDANARMQLSYDVRIYNSSGSLVQQVITGNERVELDLSSLSDGNYYLHICNGIDTPTVQPFVVENRN